MNTCLNFNAQGWLRIHTRLHISVQHFVMLYITAYVHSCTQMCRQCVLSMSTWTDCCELISCKNASYDADALCPPSFRSLKVHGCVSYVVTPPDRVCSNKRYAVEQSSMPDVVKTQLQWRFAVIQWIGRLLPPYLS